MHLLHYLIPALLVGFSCAQNGLNVNGGIVPTVEAIDSSDLAFNSLLTEAGSAHRFSMAWNVTNRGTTREQLDIVMTLSGPGISTAYMAVGLGSSMLNTKEIFVCHLYADRSVKIHEHRTNGNYAPPPKYPGDWAIIPISGSTDGSSTFSCRFSRPTVPNDGRHVNIDLNSQDLIWSYSPAGKGSFGFHSPSARGNLKSVLSSGVLLRASSASFETKQLHGFGMALVWLILFPFAIAYARYFRSTAGWIYVHALLQVVGIIGVIVFLFVAVSVTTTTTSPHFAIGFTLVAAIVVQLLLGVGNAMTLRFGSSPRNSSLIKLFHRYFGFAMIIMAFIQVYFGLDILYPFENPRENWPWVVYFVLIGGWAAIFIAAEIYTYLLQRSAEKSGKQISTGSNKGDDQKSEYRNAAVEKRIAGAMTGPKGDLKSYTWESIDKEITENGALLVVANGKYVYDVSKWINSHPGGQIILYSVIGSDITNDYFLEAGFDAEQFVPKKEIEYKSREAADRVSLSSLSTPSMHESIRGSMDSSAFRRSPTMTEQDWKILVKARRTHIHTKLAIQKLSNLLVGEIRHDDVAYSSSAATVMTAGPKTFQKFEYRRYAITEKELVTDASAASPVYRFRFCSLYPYDGRENEPERFEAGEAIEIQARISGAFVSRFYSPTGTLANFEIYVKAVPDGVMSGYLVKQRVGERQFKIRGPFGEPLLSPMRPLTFGGTAWIPSDVYYICGGSGLTPFIQLLHQLLLPVHEPLAVVSGYKRERPDELELAVHDTVVLRDHFYDGWVFGLNLRTQQEGVFPLSHVLPRCGARTRMTLVNCVSSVADIFATMPLEGGMLAYPGTLEVHHVVSGDGDLAPTEREGVAGYVHQQRLDGALLEQICGPDAFRPAEADLAAGQISRAFVCGGNGFNSMVVDALTEMGADSSVIQVLPADRL